MFRRYLPTLLAFLFVRLAAASELTFERHIRPILRAHCLDCHGAGEEPAGGLDMRLVRWLRAGGDSGPAIEAGNSAASLLVARIVAGEMPPGNHPVPAAELARLREWIDGGAKTARAEPNELGPGIEITPEEREYWAFQPIRRPAAPAVGQPDRVRTPIDAFLSAKQAAAGLCFAPDADPVTLVRRAYWDLWGLPPTEDQVAEFLADDRPDAWERLLDRLLESPHYGERWARHWLDVAGYAESDGGERDDPRAWAYRYRDWVIRALQEDMPFDQFILWQLAGDELVPRPLPELDPHQIDQLTATGFLRMAADSTGAKNDDETRNQVVADTLKIVGSSLLGLSVGCAQCHDHRYDPISHVDYHRLRAVFEPALDYRAWRVPAERLISLQTEAQAVEAARIEAEAQVVVVERAAQEQAYLEAALQGELAKLDPAIQGPLAAAYRATADQRTDAQRQLLEQYPSVGKLHPGVLYQYNQQAADQLKQLDQRIAEIRARQPAIAYLQALVEPTAAAVPETLLFHRGDYRQPRFAVEPGGFAVMAPEDSPFQIDVRDSRLPTTGRRLAFARWLTNGRHPLVARVLVNRFWLHHFGQTFVATPDEFGRLGAPPVHPELLDWLADEFMAHNWSLRHLQRMIMRSTVYRQQSWGAEEARQQDPANQLYGRFPVRRLEAEAIRDGILAVSGCLDLTIGGPSVPVTADAAGQMVVTGERQRRSIYLQVRRTQPVAFLESFDAPVMEVNCGVRNRSTVAPQALMLLNSEFILQAAAAWAERLAAEPFPTELDRLAGAWRRAFARAPTSTELAAAAEFYREQVTLHTTRQHAAPARQALVDYVQSLLSANSFLYLD